MSNVFVIEAEGHPAGLLIREHREFTFVASDPEFASLEHRRFLRPEAAEWAATRLYLQNRPVQ